MNIGFYDPISERWIKPRPEKPVEAVDHVSLGEALLNAVEAAALKERNEKIWEYLKQSAEGCNAAPIAAPEVIKPGEWISAPIVTSVPPEYEIVESLGYVYWKLKDDQCSEQQE